MKIKVADYLVKRLLELNITEVFGLPGDYNFDIVEAIEKNEKVNWIGSTNELNAGYAADGYARTKGYGAIVTTFGVGELSAINAIAGCMAENVPVMKITGVPSTKHIEAKTRLHHNLADVNYYAFKNAFDNVVEASAFLTKENAKQEIDRLINTMVQTKRPVYLALPMDVCSVEIEDEFVLLEEKSNTKSLNEAVDEIIKEIKKSRKPIVVADVLAHRFNIDKEVNRFLEKTKIPSTNFFRGIGIIDSTTTNYFGTFCSKLANKECDDYLMTTDCPILIGAVVSDLNTMQFGYHFDLESAIEIQPKYTRVRDVIFKDILMKDLMEKLIEKIDYVSSKNVEFGLGYEKAEIKNVEKLSNKYIYPRLLDFIKEGDNLIAEVGIVPFGFLKMKLPKNITFQTQLLWGSIGWATPAAFGSSIADRTKRTILVTGDGAHQLTASEISTMMRNNVKPIIFVVNNSGYTVERILCDDVDYKYNDIAAWNYSLLPKVFKGECFSASIKTNEEFDEVLKCIEKEERMCYIELCTDYLDIPELASAMVKHPEKIKNALV